MAYPAKITNKELADMGFELIQYTPEFDECMCDSKCIFGDIPACPFNNQCGRGYFTSDNDKPTSVALIEVRLVHL